MEDHNLLVNHVEVILILYIIYQIINVFNNVQVANMLKLIHQHVKIAVVNV